MAIFDCDTDARLYSHHNEKDYAPICRGDDYKVEIRTGFRRFGVEWQQLSIKGRVNHSKLYKNKFAEINALKDRLVKRWINMENKIYRLIAKEGYQGYYNVNRGWEEPVVEVLSRKNCIDFVFWMPIGVWAERIK